MKGNQFFISENDEEKLLLPLKHSKFREKNFHIFSNTDLF